MVDPEKVYLMTKAAAFEKREAKNALRIVNYRRKDYILSRMLLVLLSATIAYAILVGTVIFLVIMANEALVLSVTEMVFILLAILAGYIVVLLFYYVVSHKFYGERHVKARREVKQYLTVLHALNRIQEEQSK
ncbi:MAG: hypothetical protein IKY02_02250 [Lachnospiraceae bacterium]|nr:hypothetical protein [Lachnospiraceae bacterium]MBR5738791.1 hypothetical protein [Lachnospiraceae bacterium]